MKKKIPVIVAVVLILLVIASVAGLKLIDKYSYSKSEMDLKEYYKIEDDGEAAIVLQDALIETKALVEEGRCYLDVKSVHELLNSRFYVDAEGLLIYSLPTDIIVSPVDSTICSTGYYAGNVTEEDKGYRISFYEGETLYIALDYVKEYTDFEYELYTEPNRIKMYTAWQEQKKADIKKDTNVRYQGGVKSDILTPVTEGSPVIILEEMENWSRVMTEDAVIGYVENKRLTGERSEMQLAVTDYEEPDYTGTVKDYTISLAWHQVTNLSANNTLNDTLAATRSINTISPTWFSLSDNQGNFSSIASADYVNTAHQRGIEVWALIDDFNKEVSTYQVLSAKTTRSALIQNLIGTAKQYGLDGINIDFENIPAEAGEAFIQFIRELSIPCRASGIVLSVDNYVPKDHSSHYNRAEQGVVADYVIIMGYDEHWGGGGVAGSVASIDFVEEGILNTIAEVPAEKVINAVPFYTRVWKTANGEVTSEAVGMDTASAFLERNSVTASWDEATCQNYAEFEKEGTLYQVWLEDEQSLEVKLNIMRMNHLAGVAAWKLGFERPSAWDTIAAYVEQPK